MGIFGSKYSEKEVDEILKKVLRTTTPNIPGKEYEIIGSVCSIKQNNLKASEFGISKQALDMGADAVIGIQSSVAADGTVLTFILYGTAVKYK